MKGSFEFLRRSSFINFFINNLIDTPVCFKKVKSLRRLNYELPLLKLINFLTKKGKKEQLQVFFFKALTEAYKEYKFSFKKAEFIKRDWVKTYLIFSNTFQTFKEQYLVGQITSYKYKYELDFNNYLTFYGKKIAYASHTKNFLLKKLIFVLPIFSFFIHNVDKNVKKFSRGKAGKYSFV
jgi:hypothetical protein